VFFVKKEPKTFANALVFPASARGERRRHRQKFFVSFFQKRKLFLVPLTYQPQPLHHRHGMAIEVLPSLAQITQITLALLRLHQPGAWALAPA
jgi:hypothetical protein